MHTDTSVIIIIIIVIIIIIIITNHHIVYMGGALNALKIYLDAELLDDGGLLT